MRIIEHYEEYKLKAVHLLQRSAADAAGVAGSGPRVELKNASESVSMISGHQIFLLTA